VIIAVPYLKRGCLKIPFIEAVIASEALPALPFRQAGKQSANLQ
jgi:hypothetical protein